MKNIWKYVIAFLILGFILYAFVSLIIISHEEKIKRGCELGNECKCKKICEKAGYNIFSYSSNLFSHACYCIKNGESIRVG